MGVRTVMSCQDASGELPMSEIDYALGWAVIDAAEGIPRQLRFRGDWVHDADSRSLSGAGQLVAVVGDPGRPDFGDTLPISRANVSLSEVDAVLIGWRSWAQVSPKRADLATIRQRITAAGLGVG